MRILIGLLAALWAAPLWDKGETAGNFDYYVLSLSWSPTWCALEGDARDAQQCDKDFGWVLHGLWPQNDSGYPSYCTDAGRDPSRRMTNAMADIMGSGGLAWYQWKKHGRCSGLSGARYLEHARRAFDSITRPRVLRKVTKDIKLPATLIEDAWIQANPTLKRDQITITCRDSRIQETRICLTKDLQPRRCGKDVIRDCTLPDALFSPIR